MGARQPSKGKDKMKRLLAVLLVLGLGLFPAVATETTRSALQTQNSANIISNGSGAISAVTLNSLLANIIDSAGAQLSPNTWAEQNIFSAELRAKRLNLTDRGACTMTAGTCSAQALASTYTSAPTCVATWTGTGALAGTLKIASTTSTVTPSSNNAADTAQVNWLCFGN